MQIDFTKVKLNIFNGRFQPNDHLSAHAEKAFSFWFQNWQAVYNKIFDNKALYADDFNRQEEIITLSLNNEIVGLIGLDYFDIQRSSHLKHSYFSQVPFSVFSKIQEMGVGESLSINQLMVAPEYRKSIGVSDVLVAICVLRLELSRISHAICYTRNLGKVNYLAQRWSGEVIESNLTINNEPSDFVVFPKKSFELSEMTSYKELALFLWEEMMAEPGSYSLSSKLNEDSSLSFDSNINYKNYLLSSINKGEPNERNEF